MSIFTNLDWDTAQAWSHDLFDSMWDWLDYLIPIMKQNEHTLFVIRAHPAEAYMVKKTFNTTKNWFYENKLDEYENIILIDSDTPYNSYELIKKSNFCLISNSTIGLEAQYLKTPALASSWVYYTNFDLVTKPKSLQEYKNVLNDWLAGNYQKLENYNFDKLYSYMYQYFFETEFTFEDYIENYQSSHYAFKNKSIVTIKTIDKYQEIVEGIVKKEVLKNMEKFKILIPLRDYKYYQDISPALSYLDKEKYEIIFLSYEKLNNVENLFIVEKYFKNIEKAERYLLDSSISPEMYRCDPRYFFEIKSENELIIEQANIERYYNNFILNENIDIVFSGAASYGIWTIPHEISKSKKINSYRMYDFSHLNIDISEPRTWFTQDIYMESWEIENYKFSWNDVEVESFINDYFNGIKENSIVLSKTAIPHRNLFYADSFF